MKDGIIPCTVLQQCTACTMGNMWYYIPVWWKLTHHFQLWKFLSRVIQVTAIWQAIFPVKTIKFGASVETCQTIDMRGSLREPSVITLITQEHWDPADKKRTLFLVSYIESWGGGGGFMVLLYSATLCHQWNYWAFHKTLPNSTRRLFWSCFHTASIRPGESAVHGSGCLHRIR